MNDERADRIIALLIEIRDELRSWKEGPTSCPHPEDQLRNLSTMGHKHIQCGICGQDLVRQP